MEHQYNMRNPAVKRLMKEAQELKDATEQYYAHPLEDNLFEWHFTIRGPAGTEFESGMYHGRIVLPPDYPMKPPSIILLTPQGRFELNTKICLSISGHHPESWRPSWSIRTALLAIIGFMPTHGGGAIGSLNYTSDERKVLAHKSKEWQCPNCGQIKSLLKPVTDASKETEKEAKELASQIDFQGEQPTSNSKESTDKDQSKQMPSADQSTVTSSPTDTDPSSTTAPPSPSAAAASPAAGPPSPLPPLPPLPPGMTPEMFHQMMRFMPPPPPHGHPGHPGHPGQFPGTQTPWPSWPPQQPPFPIPSTIPSSSTPDNMSTQVRQRTTQSSVSASSVPAPSSEPARVLRRTAVETSIDYVSCIIVLLCSLAVALVVVRKSGILDMDTLRKYYEYL